MFVVRKENAYRPPRPVTGIALLLLLPYIALLKVYNGEVTSSSLPVS
jgi:hypothetical protein